jgi:uncharacterized protein
MTPFQRLNRIEPLRPGRRLAVVDILRGFAVLGILLVNMLSFSGYPYTSGAEMGTVDRVATLLIRFVAQAKFYTLFSFLFGWGTVIQMRRAAARGGSFAPFYVRRMVTLLLIGLLHTVLIWDGDILVTYAVLGLALLLFRKRSSKFILVAAVVSILVPLLLSTPGPAESVRAWHAGLVAPLRQQVVQAHQANVYAQGSYVEAVSLRVKATVLGYTNLMYWAAHILGMSLLGTYVGRRRIFQNVTEHLPLVRRVLWSSLIMGLTLNTIFVLATDSPAIVPSRYQDLATRGARALAGSALCLSYVCSIVLLTQRRSWLQRLSPLAYVGRTALSNYLLQSVICTFLFYGYGLGLYRKLGPAITVVVTLLLFRAQVSLSTWWLERHRFGPVEWLWRSLTYGSRQLWRSEDTDSLGVVGRSADAIEVPSTVLASVSFLLNRLAFIAAVAFAVVFFCTVGVRLGVNSRVSGEQRRTVWDVANPSVSESVDFFSDLFRGDLGLVGPGISERAWQPATRVLAAAYMDSVRLLIVAVGLAALIGVLVGSLAAVWRHSALSLPALTLTVVGVSVPSFLLSLLIQTGSIEFYKATGIRLFLFGPALGDAKSLLPKMALPVLVLFVRPVAHITRVTFVSLSDVLERDYVRTARAKGQREALVFWNHALRNAAVSILTAVVVSFRFALGSLPVAEIFFDWPGLGVTMLNGIFARDATVVAGAALGLGVTFLMINMALDLIYRVIDPRLRGHGNGGTP